MTKGLFSIATGISVAAEKNVDLPTFVFPRSPTYIFGGGVL